MKTLCSFIAIKIALFIAFTLILSSCADKIRLEDSATHLVNHQEVKIEKFVLEFDRQFIVNAAEISIEQIQLGQLAQHNSNMIDVMRLGKMIQLEHHSSLQTLNTIAQKKSVHLPVSMTDSAMDTYTTFRKKA